MYVKQGYSLEIMSNRIRKLLLVIVTIALVVSPLRGALALPITAAADGTDHCVQMQNAMHSHVYMDEMQNSTADDSDHDNDQCCSDNCCDGSCNTCAQGSIALSSHIVTASDIHDNLLNKTISCSVPGSTVHPPFRPPISLPG